MTAKSSISKVAKAKRLCIQIGLALALFWAGRLVAYRFRSPPPMAIRATISAAVETEHTISSNPHFEEEPSVENFHRMSSPQRKWFLYELVNKPAFRITREADWSNLRELLDSDREGTLRSLADIDVKQSNASVEIPLYLASYLADLPINQSAKILESVRANPFLHRSSMQQLVAQIDDRGSRSDELFSLLDGDPFSQSAQDAAEMIALRYSSKRSPQELVAYANRLPTGATRGNFLSGVVINSVNPHEMDTLLRSLNNSQGEFDQAIDYHVDKLSIDSPEQALTWIDSIQSSHHQRSALAGLFANWGEKDARSFLHWVDRNAHLTVQPIYWRSLSAAYSQLGMYDRLDALDEIAIEDPL